MSENEKAFLWIIKNNGVIQNVKCKGMVLSHSNEEGDLTIKEAADTDGWVQVRLPFISHQCIVYGQVPSLNSFCIDRNGQSNQILQYY